MFENGQSRGVPLPSFWHTCVLAAAIAGAWLVWSEFRGRGHRIAVVPARDDPVGNFQAVNSLVRDGRSALPNLVRLLSSDEAATRRNALLSLRELGADASEAQDAVFQRLSDESAVVREYALAAFARICSDEGRVDEAAVRLLADPQAEVRDEAAAILKASGPRAIPAVSATAHSDHPIARRLAVLILTQVDPEHDSGEVNLALRGFIRDPDAAVRLAAIAALAANGRARIDDLRSWLRDDDPNIVQHGLHAICWLGAEAADAVPELQALLDDVGGTRPWPAGELKYMKAAARPLVPALLRRAGSPDAQTRLAVARTLIEMGVDDVDIASILRSVLSDDEDSAGRAALRLLAQISPDEAGRQISRLIAKLEAREKWICPSDLEALMGIGNEAKEAVPLLIRLLSHPAPYVSTNALVVLRDIGPDGAEAIPSLLALFNQNPSSWVIRALALLPQPLV